mmetsp:Transcript_2854/g.8713  ORF Transcript_2854/g.8713 Transcript_2854/m.8713 type:complete len:193 (-) Transcript_2854:244-822(-)
MLKEASSDGLKRSSVGNQLKKPSSGLKREREYCIFFQRFGECPRRSCHYTHDKSKVSICRRFLLRTCAGSSCLLSHTYDTTKVPVCTKFLDGVCAAENCSFLHVNAGAKSSVCERFAKLGFCEMGELCSYLHQWRCPKELGYGRCGSIDSCPYLHDMRKVPVRSGTKQAAVGAGLNERVSRPWGMRLESNRE